jgi:hypothetical protein
MVRDRYRVRRQPARGRYDRPTIDAVLDAGLMAHVAFVDHGQPYAIPMLYARVGDQVYVHGSTASRAVRELGSGVPACLTVSMIDGLVLARSVFGHSANYRSVMLLGAFGARFCVWEANARDGAELINEPRAWDISSLRTTDIEGSKASLYASMFGWQPEVFGGADSPISVWRLPGYVGGQPQQPAPRDPVAVMTPVGGLGSAGKARERHSRSASRRTMRTSD